MTTHAHLTAAFSSLLTAAIHTILYERSIYPRASFLTTRFHNYPVHQSRHPLVCQWINDAVSATSVLLVQGSVKHVVVVIYDPQNVPQERFIFDVERFPVVEASKRDLVIERSSGDQTASEGEVDLENAHGCLEVEISESFRAVMARLGNISTRLAPLPSDCSFNIAVELKDEAEPPIGHPQPWIPSDPSLQINSNDDEGIKKPESNLGGAKTVPVRAIEAGEMLLEVWVEEGKAKFEGGGGKPSETND